MGVASSWNEATPCNLTLNRQAPAAKIGVSQAGGTPREFVTIAVSDGIAMGHEGMKASLVSREVIADSAFGVGSIIDFTDKSLMPAGLDVWPYELADPATRTEILKTSQVVDGRLARRLRTELGRPIDFFLTPNEAPDYRPGQGAPQMDRAPMPLVPFPNWHFCPRC